jgi:predicted PurR-regulated permease PerM
MATRLDRIIERLRKITKETWFLYQKILNDYREYILLYSLNIHWPTKTIEEIRELYNKLNNMHQQLIQDMEKLLPNIRYLTTRTDEQLAILNILLSKIRNMENVNKELLEMQKHILQS